MNENKKTDEITDNGSPLSAPPGSTVIPVTHGIRIEIPDGEGLPKLLLQLLRSVGAEEFARNFSGGRVEIQSHKPDLCILDSASGMVRRVESAENR